MSAKDPETGEKLTPEAIASESFAFMKCIKYSSSEMFQTTQNTMIRWWVEVMRWWVVGGSAPRNSVYQRSACLSRWVVGEAVQRWARRRERGRFQVVRPHNELAVLFLASRAGGGWRYGSVGGSSWEKMEKGTYA